MNTEKQVIVRQYGLLPPVDWADDCREQLFLCNKLWNKLVEIERDYQAKWQDKFAEDPAYAALKEKLDALKIEINAAWAERKKNRAKARSKSTETDEAEGIAIKSLSQQRSALWAQMKELRTKLKPAFKDALDALENDRRAQVKEARQQSGLFWSNYNAIIDDYNTARSKAMKEGAMLRFHAFDGTGRFVNQIQGGAKISEIMAGRHNMFQIKPVADDAYALPFRGDRRRAARTVLTITAYTVKKGEDGRHYRRTLEFPMVMNRPVPEDADIKFIEVVAKRVGPEILWTATITATREGVAPAHEGHSACGINLGWRATLDGLRVATVVDSQGRSEHLHLPKSVIDDLEYCERIQSEMDAAADAIRQEIAAWMDEVEISCEETPEGWMDAAKAARLSQGAGKINRFAEMWWEWPFQPKWAMVIETWRKSNKRNYLEIANLRAKALGRRREAYRIFAKKIADSYAVVGIGQLGLKKAASLRVGTEENDLPAAARKNRVYASLYELSDWLGKQAAKTGAVLVKADRPVTDTCHACGRKSSVPPDALVHRCQHCQTVYDRDENAALIALQDAIGGPLKPSGQQAEKHAEKPEKRAA